MHNGTITAKLSSTSGNLCVTGSSYSLEFDGDSGFITLDGPIKGWLVIHLKDGWFCQGLCCWVKIGDPVK